MDTLEAGAAPQDLAEKPAHERREFDITVNERPVQMAGREHTGAQIKAAAIAQGVDIKSDFVLSVELGHKKTKVVGDDETVKLKQHERFVAVADDDNS
jgi:hypothetical protein